MTRIFKRKWEFTINFTTEVMRTFFLVKRHVVGVEHLIVLRVSWSCILPKIDKIIMCVFVDFAAASYSSKLGTVRIQFFSKVALYDSIGINEKIALIIRFWRIPIPSKSTDSSINNQICLLITCFKYNW